MAKSAALSSDSYRQNHAGYYQNCDRLDSEVLFEAKWKNLWCSRLWVKALTSGLVFWRQLSRTRFDLPELVHYTYTAQPRIVQLTQAMQLWDLAEGLRWKYQAGETSWLIGSQMSDTQWFKQGHTEADKTVHIPLNELREQRLRKLDKGAEYREAVTVVCAACCRTNLKLGICRWKSRRSLCFV